MIDLIHGMILKVRNVGVNKKLEMIVKFDKIRRILLKAKLEFEENFIYFYYEIWYMFGVYTRDYNSLIELISEKFE